MNKKQNKKGWRGFSALAGICFAVAIFLFYYVYYQFLFERTNILLIYVGIGFIFASLIFLFFKEREKEMAVIFLVFAIILFSGVIGIYIKDYQEEQEWERIWDMQKMMAIEDIKWSMIWQKRAENAYQNYTNDSEMMDAFTSIATIHPFLKEQMNHLREYMVILVNNVTIDNYTCAYEQFVLCYTIDRDYSENYTFYFNQYNELYEEDLS